MMKALHLMVLAVTLGWLVGCSSTGDSKSDDVVVEDQGTEAGAYGDATATGVGAYGDLSIEALNDPNSPLSQRVIYFAYDSSTVDPQDADLVAAHAAFLAANPDVKVSLEGHSDERGSREYNIALGDHRAQAVRRMFEFQGVSAAQITTVSFGEEKPAADGHDETSYSLSRRVELVYVGY